MSTGCMEASFGMESCDRLRRAEDPLEARMHCIRIGISVLEQTGENLACPLGEFEKNPRIVEDILEAQNLESLEG